MTTPDPFASGYRLTDGNQLNIEIANPQWSTTSAISATSGGTMLTSAKIVNAITNITAASAPGAGLTLPQALLGKVVIVSNNASNDVRIFADGDSTINGLSGLIGIILPKGTTGIFTATATQEWSQLNTTNNSGIQTVDTIAALRYKTVNTTTLTLVEGYYAVGDGGGGYFYGVTGAAPGTYVDNGGTIIVPFGGDGSKAWLRDGVNSSTFAWEGSEQVSVRWFGAKGDQTTDDTTAFQNAIGFLANGGVLLIPQGRYFVTSTLYLPSGITIKGESNVDRTFGTPNPNANASYIFQETVGESVFGISGNRRQIRFMDISLGARAYVNLNFVPGINGVSFSDTYSNSSTDFVFERCGFYNFARGVSVEDNALPHPGTPDWQCDDVSFNNCTFYINEVGVYFNTTNADSWVFTNVDFFSGDNADGIYISRAGTMTLINCFGGDLVSNPPVNASGMVIGGDGFFDTIKMINCQWENVNNQLAVIASYYPNQPVGALKIIMDSCQIEAEITLAAACNYISFGSRYTHNVYATGSNIILESYSDYFTSPSKYIISGANSSLYTAITSSQSSVITTQNGWILGGRIERRDSVIPPTSAGFNPGDITWVDAPRLGQNLGWVLDYTNNWVTFGQAGNRSGTGSPSGAVTPYFIGEEWLDTAGPTWYKATGLTNTSWVALN